MAKNKEKENVPAEAENIAGTDTGAAGVDSGSASAINTEKEAKELVVSNYEVPEGTKTVFVTSDACVFWSENEGSARNHAANKNLKLFTLQWD